MRAPRACWVARPGDGPGAAHSCKIVAHSRCPFAHVNALYTHTHARVPSVLTQGSLFIGLGPHHHFHRCAFHSHRLTPCIFVMLIPCLRPQEISAWSQGSGLGPHRHFRPIHPCAHLHRTLIQCSSHAHPMHSCAQPLTHCEWSPIMLILIMPIPLPLAGEMSPGYHAGTGEPSRYR